MCGVGPVRDLAFVAFLGALFLLAFKRPFLFTLAYAYIDTVSPQRLSYFLLNSIPISQIAAAAAIGSWLLLDDKRHFTITPRQWLMLFLLAYCGATTAYADFPIEAYDKWDWAWKALAFGIFLPWILRTRLRIEALLLFMVLSLSTIVVVGGIKTALSGGGYGALNLMVDNNSGLYEGSILSTFAIATIPLILWFMRFGTIFPAAALPATAPGAARRRFSFDHPMLVKLYGAALIFACLLIPIGTEARTGLVCIGLLGLLTLRDVKRRMLYIAGAGLIGLAAVPFLPQSFTNRMETIQGYQSDESAGTRLAVWGWTLQFVQGRPFGGGFEAYRQNRIQVQTVDAQTSGEFSMVATRTQADQGRAWHSAYFEMLGEQGWPGLLLFLLIHGTGIVRMELIRRRYRSAAEGDEWIAPLATALQHFQIIYLLGAAFVAVAFQPFIWMAIGTQIGFDAWLRRREREQARRPFRAEAAVQAA